MGEAVNWREVPGWATDSHAQAWPALLHSCRRLEKGERPWPRLCAEARSLGTPDDAAARAFFEARFAPRALWDDDGDRTGLITGYYEPLLEGSRVRTQVFRYPVYGRPKDLLTIDSGGVFPDLQGRPLRGRMTQGGRVVPYFSRAQIEGPEDPLQGNEIAWVEDPVALFFLHIQGSGRIRLRDGAELPVGYADRNGHPYVPIGRALIQSGEIAREDMSLRAIRDWLSANPHKRRETLNTNPNYIFFAVRGIPGSDPVGALGVPLTRARSIAADPGFIPPGFPVWMDTTLPGEDGAREGQPFRRLVFAQDTGSAIRGPVRADLFLGSGRIAEARAGRMRQRGQLHVLWPKASWGTRYPRE